MPLRISPGSYKALKNPSSGRSTQALQERDFEPLLATRKELNGRSRRNWKEQSSSEPKFFLGQISSEAGGQVKEDHRLDGMKTSRMRLY